MKLKSESEVAQLCPTLSDPMDCSLPGSSIHRIFQARVLEWGAIAFSTGDGAGGGKSPRLRTAASLEEGQGLKGSWDSTFSLQEGKQGGGPTRKGEEPEGSPWTKFGINRTNYGLTIFDLWSTLMSFPGGSVVKNSPAIAGDKGDTALIPGSGRPPGGGNGNPLQYSCLENPTDRGVWWAAVHGVAKSWTRLK